MRGLDLSGAICLSGKRSNLGKHDIFQARKKSTNPNFWVRIFSGGVGIFHVKGRGPKSSGMSPETREIKLFGRDVPGFCRDIAEEPEKFEKKKFVFHSRPLFLPPPDTILLLSTSVLFGCKSHRESPQKVSERKAHEHKQMCGVASRGCSRTGWVAKLCFICCGVPKKAHKQNPLQRAGGGGGEIPRPHKTVENG